MGLHKTSRLLKGAQSSGKAEHVCAVVNSQEKHRLWAVVATLLISGGDLNLSCAAVQVLSLQGTLVLCLISLP